jgi:hypothetical protein
MATNPFKLEILDKAFSFQCNVGDPLRLTFTPRHNQQSTGELVMRARHHAVPTLAVPGTRYRLWYKDEFMSSGTIDLRAAQGPAGEAAVTYQLKDDFAILYGTLGWQVPTSPISDQTAKEYAVYTGTAEKIAKDMIRDNALTRIGRPLVIAANQDRGGTVSGGVKVRMGDLGETLLPMLEAAGLGIRFRNLSGATIQCDVYVPSTSALQLTEAGGQVLDYSWTARNPTATRVVAGGSGEKKARYFNQYISTMVESEYGLVIEAFTDAADLGDALRDAENDMENKFDALKGLRETMVDDRNAMERAKNKRDVLLASRNVAQAVGGQTYTDANAAYSSANSDYSSANAQYTNSLNAYNAGVTAYNNAVTAKNAAITAHRAELEQRAKEKVAEGHPTYGFDLTLGEAPNFTYGGLGVHVGDQVTVDAGGLVITDVLRSATLNWDADSGLTVTPVVGDNIEENPDRKLGALIATAFRAIQKLRTGR